MAMKRSYFIHAAGAVVAGCRPELIHARRARLTYGVGLSIEYEEGFPGKFVHRETGELLTDRGFQLFVSKDDLVCPGLLMQPTDL